MDAIGELQTFKAGFFRALAHPARIRILEILVKGGRSVQELQAALDLDQPVVSQHLAVLKSAGLVKDEAAGTRRIYQIDPKGLGTIRAWLDQFWDTALASFKDEVEGTKGKR